MDHDFLLYVVRFTEKSRLYVHEARRVDRWKIHQGHAAKKFVATDRERERKKEREGERENKAYLKKGLRSNLFHVPARYIKRSTGKTW